MMLAENSVVIVASYKGSVRHFAVANVIMNSL